MGRLVGARSGRLGDEASPKIRTLIGQAQQLLQRVNSEDDPAELARFADADATANVKAYPGDVDALLIQVEADWRAWLLTARSLRGDRLRSRAPQRRSFPVAHLPSRWGNEFVNAANGASTDRGYTAADVAECADVSCAVEGGRSRFASSRRSTRFRTTSTSRRSRRRTSISGRWACRFSKSRTGSSISTSCSTTITATRERKAPTWRTAIVDMQKVYPRDRDLPMLLYWCYTTLERMNDDSAASRRSNSRDSHHRIPGQPASPKALGT